MAPAKVESFYDTLFLLQFLAPVQTVASTIRRTKKAKTPWETNLDYMAMLLDSDFVVPSIAVEQVSEDRARYWVATNDPAEQKRCVEVLRQVLQTLSQSDLQNSQARYNIRIKLLGMATEHCKPSIREYRRRLRVVMDKLKNVSSSGSCAKQKREIMAYLDESVLTGQKPYLVVKNCFKVRRDSLRLCLEQIIMDEGTEPEWAQVKHLIGRLGALVVASGTVVNYYRHNPIKSGDFEVLAAPNVKYYERGSIFDWETFRTTLSSLGTMYSTESMERTLESRYHGLYSTFEEHLDEHLHKHRVKTLIHSEVALLEYFLRNRLAFWNDQAYIGCSKDSCLCCSRWIDHRSEGRIRRNCHGNAYAAWGLPRFDTARDQARKAYEESFKHVSWFAQQDLLDKVTSDGRWAQKLCDSATCSASCSATLSI